MDAPRGLRRRLFPNAADSQDAEYLESFAEQPDVVVRFVAWLLGALHAVLSAPRALVLVLTRPTRIAEAGGGMYVNYVYGVVWVVALWALLLAGNWTSSRVFLFTAAGVGGWRLFEIVAWWMKLLFDRGHDLLVSPERNLLFLLLDALSVSFAIAAFVRLDTPAAAAAPHWVDALAIGTLSGAPSEVHVGPWTELAVVLGTLAGLLLLAAGLALLVESIGGKFKEDRPYTGPLRPPFAAVGGKAGARTRTGT